MSRTEIKLRAKTEFKDHWGVLLLILALEWVAKCIATVLGFGLGSLIVAGPLCVGIYYVYTKTIYNEGTDWKDMFFGFRTLFGNSFGVYILVWFITSVLDIITGIVLRILVLIFAKIQMGVASAGYSYDDYSYGYPYDPSFGSSLLMTAGIGIASIFIAIIVFAVVGVIIDLFYAEAPLLLLKESDIKTVDALKKSRLMMSGNKGRLFIFELSFIGWFILCILTLGVLLVYVAPYYMYAKVLLLNQIYEERHGVSMDDDADLQRLNAMKANVKNRTDAVTDKIKEKKAEHEAAREAAPAYEPPQPEPTEPEVPEPFEPAEPEPADEPLDLEETIELEEPVVPNVCRYCGAKLPEGASFCGKCGRRQ